ncbi:hypothetical protein SAMN05216390_103167 [Lachnospiraceae bacterium KH1T2]|nr:hypothetical protein SAMN05216390_103167 [Lachnospiraceae bacterium KH1T2]
MTPTRKRAVPLTTATVTPKVVLEKKVEEVKPAEAKTTAKKTEAKKTTSKKAAVKKPTTYEYVLQFQGKEVSSNDLNARFAEVWTKDLGKSLSDVKKVTYYIKPEESAAYFVVNDTDEGSFGI